MLDWDDIRFFLAVTRHGNLSAAARELRVSQPTVGRRLASLEASLGVRLLNRTPDGFVLTPAGQEIREKAERLERDAHALERMVGGRDEGYSGLVRVTCAETMAAHILAPCFASLAREHSQIVVELIPDARELNLLMREAELSVRLTQPNQHDLVVRRVGSLAFGLYASPDYLERHGDLDFNGGCPGHQLIAQLDDIQDTPQFGWLSDLTPLARVSFQTSSHEAAVSAALHGVGLACLARFRADKEAGLVRLQPSLPIPTTGIWLVVHKDNRDTTRIRAVMMHVVDWLRTQRASLMPDGSAKANSGQDGSSATSRDRNSETTS